MIEPHSILLKWESAIYDRNISILGAGQFMLEKYVMTDQVPFQIKDLERLNCLLITTDLFYMFLSQSRFREIIQTHVIRS